MRVEGNEQVNVLAKDVASSARPPTGHHPFPTVDLHPYINIAVHSCLQDRWNTFGFNKIHDIHQGMGRGATVAYPIVGKQLLSVSASDTLDFNGEGDPSLL